MSLSMIPNLITMVRIIGSLCLFFVKPMGVAFYIIYTISGLSDAVDGFIARKTNSISELGSKLDSIADLMFYIVMIIRILPELVKKLPYWIWYMVLAVVIMRIASYTIAAIRFHKFSSLHTLLNKAATLLIFFVPYIIKSRVLSPFCTVICIIGIVS
ncbi:MAG: CDP-alcohol phosphatidyltransferase family protein, partial [Clostridia bacterium]|nr:CDP-alcohol phosphatidyltransferase family protein [Clostridia bacterium]